MFVHDGEDLVVANAERKPAGSMEEKENSEPGAIWESGEILCGSGAESTAFYALAVE